MTHPDQEAVGFRPDGGVVVGDDGSACAAAAVRSAAAEAQRRGEALHVVRCWSIPTAVRPEDVPPGIVPSLLEFQAATLAAEERRVRELLGGAEAAAAFVHVVHAPPAKTLLAAAETADLLVVGTRGRGGFERLLLGSVAEQCIRHAACSVLVVRTG
jgi:nucleotide-binding universal stress UspA family protein